MERFKVIIWSGNISHKDEKLGSFQLRSFHGEEKFSLSNTAVLKLWSYWALQKNFIGYLFTLYYCCFTCFTLNLLSLARPKVKFKKC